MKLILKLTVANFEDAIDPLEDWNVNWESFSEEDKDAMVADWASNYINYSFEEVKDE